MPVPLNLNFFISSKVSCLLIVYKLNLRISFVFCSLIRTALFQIVLPMRTNTFSSFGKVRPTDSSSFVEIGSQLGMIFDLIG